MQLENGQKVYEDQLSYVIGEESTVPGIEKCLRNMRWGEVGLFVLHPYYGYGEEGNQERGSSHRVSAPVLVCELTL
jgi:FKBP-type peptidyl-prolyl cis-trans isomerase 2